MDDGSPGKNLTIIVPIFNEAEALPGFLAELVPVCHEKGWQIILVNDGSTDDSSRVLAAYANQPLVKIVHHKVNRGYGGALKSGIERTNTSHLVTIDGDGQHNVSEIEAVFQFALAQDADLVVGNRGNQIRAAPLRELGKWLIRRFTHLLMPLPIHDLNSGFKLYRTSLAQKYVSLCPNSMAFSDIITLTFISQRNLVLEYPITIRKRESGQSKIGFQTAFATIIEILNLALLFNPLKVFLPVSVLCILAGFGWGLPIALMGRGISVGAMLAIVLGAIFFAIGLIASQLSSMRIESLERFNSEKKPDD